LGTDGSFVDSDDFFLDLSFLEDLLSRADVDTSETDGEAFEGISVFRGDSSPVSVSSFGLIGDGSLAFEGSFVGELDLDSIWVSEFGFSALKDVGLSRGFDSKN
jgi:hypothetical protein